MSTLLPTSVDPWRVEIIAVRAHSHSATERGAIHRDVERGLARRVARGAYVEAALFESLTIEAQHIVRMRALAAVSGVPVTFSHWSAAVLHGLPVMWNRLITLHVTVPDPGRRSGSDVTGHVFGLQEQEVVSFRELRATGVGRTVADVAGAAPFEEGVITADGAVRASVPRELLLAAVDLAGTRRAGARIRDVVAFAHPGAESAAESRLRVTMMRLGHEVPVLQFRIALVDGSDAFLDAYLRRARVGIEVDGDQKYLDPEMAPRGTGRALVAEKRREDEVRTHLGGLARVGWAQAGNAVLLRRVLARVGAHPPQQRCTIADYCAAAVGARPRSAVRNPRWQP